MSCSHAARCRPTSRPTRRAIPALPAAQHHPSLAPCSRGSAGDGGSDPALLPPCTDKPPRLSRKRLPKMLLCSGGSIIPDLRRLVILRNRRLLVWWRDAFLEPAPHCICVAREVEH